MAKLTKDLGAGGVLHPRENLYVTGTLGANGAEIVVATDGAATVSLDLRGTFSMTIEVSGTIDGTNWVLIPVRSLLGGVYLASIVGTAAGAWVGVCSPFRQVRARVTAYTSGAATATLNASTAVLDQWLNGGITPLILTATGASGAGVTLTITSPGAGLRQYLTYLRVVRFSAAALVAAAAPVLITTTNLPGSLAFTCGADAQAQGVAATVLQEDFAFPLMATAQATNVTIVCPATTNVIWRVTSGYYVAS